MARGFDSKAVADQQAELERRREATREDKPRVSARRRQLELARIDIVHRMEKAPQRMRDSLALALAAVDKQLDSESDSG